MGWHLAYRGLQKKKKKRVKLHWRRCAAVCGEGLVKNLITALLITQQGQRKRSRHELRLRTSATRMRTQQTQQRSAHGCARFLAFLGDGLCGSSTLGLGGTEELLLLFFVLEASVSNLGGGIDELELDLLNTVNKTEKKNEI
jgi:hypothetical protein